MNIGIIIYSKTGHTNSVAERLKNRLDTAGYTSHIERVTALNEEQTEISKIQLKGIPNVNKYDVLIFGTPVQGFSLAPIMNAYMSKLPSLENKRAYCFVTQHFPFPWMGGNRTIKQMLKLCESKRTMITGTSVINWSNKKRESLIENFIENVVKIF